MTRFETDKKDLTFLLDQIKNRELALPDFQRDFVWDSGATRELVRSIMQSYPAGALLLLQGGDKIFAPRAVEGAPGLDGTSPAYLALDGQQRLTSLYQALFGVGTHRYFLNLQELIDGEDLDEAVEVFHARKSVRWSTIDGQARDLMLPLSRLRDYAYWREEVMESREKSGLKADKQLTYELISIGDQWITSVEKYQFPVVTLSSQTTTDAVCTIFETLNRTGVKLGVFDLLAARAFPANVRLRDMWDQARVDHSILDDFGIDPYYVLQVIALRAKGDPRRGKVLELDVATEISLHWKAAAHGIGKSLELLRDECGVLNNKWLPYGTTLITMGAAWSVIEDLKGPAIAAARDKFKRWFWCAMFTQRYENQTNSRSEQDYPELRAWVSGIAGEPTWFGQSFDPQLWRTITYRQTALYKASMSLLMSSGPQDFHNGQKLSAAYVKEYDVDDHHVFPAGYLADQNASPEHRVAADTILNRTLIDKKTNIRIGKRAPSIYLGEMAKDLGPAMLATVLSSHHLPNEADGPLLLDEFQAFLDWRLRELTSVLAAHTGWALSPDVAGAEPPEAIGSVTE